MRQGSKGKGKALENFPSGGLAGSTPESRILKALRLKSGLSQVALAKALGSHRCQIGAIERGIHRPSALYVAKLERFFGAAWGEASALDAAESRVVLRPSLVGRAEAMIADMVASSTQHRVTSVMTPDGRRAVICVAMVDDADAEALMVRALQTAAALVEEG